MLKQLPIYSPEEFESQKHPFSIKRLSTTIGAELLDIDLKKDLSQEEKDHIYKNSPWEESTRIPLTIRVPGLTKPNSKVNHPVSLIDVYPTLLELAGLDNNTIKNDKGKSLDGFSLKPFLKDPNTKKWDGPDGALSVVYSSDLNENTPSNHHYSLRTKDWRYIIYDSGKEELYHNAIDPEEWNNMIYEKTHPQRDEMVKILKEITHPMVPNGLKKLQL